MFSSQAIAFVLGGGGLACLGAFLYTIETALRRCSHRVARLPAWLVVCLIVVPFFGFLWLFFVVVALDRSLASEYRARGIAREWRPPFALGVAMSVAMLAAVGLPFFSQAISPIFSFQLASGRIGYLSPTALWLTGLDWALTAASVGLAFWFCVRIHRLSRQIAVPLRPSRA